MRYSTYICRWRQPSRPYMDCSMSSSAGALRSWLKQYSWRHEFNQSRPPRLGRQPDPCSEPPLPYLVEERPSQALPLCSQRSCWAARCWSVSFVEWAGCCRQQPGARQPLPLELHRQPLPLELHRMRPCSSPPLRRLLLCSSPTACLACSAASCDQMGLCGSQNHSCAHERLGAREHDGCMRMQVLPAN